MKLISEEYLLSYSKQILELLLLTCSQLAIFVTIFILILGGDLASTWIAKPEGHVEDVAGLVKNAAKPINANDSNYVGDDVAVAA